jgi:ATP-dependent Lon protease
VAYLSDERDEMMLTQGEHFDVLNDHHFVMVFVKDRIIQQLCVQKVRMAE